MGNKKKSNRFKEMRKLKIKFQRLKKLRFSILKMFCKSNTNVINTEIIKTVKDICTPTGNFELDKKRAQTYAKAVGMDTANSKMMEVMTTQGPQAASKAMMEDCGNDYAAMRARYG